MNWRRGANRLFAVGCVLWAVYVLIVFPIQQTKVSAQFAAQSAAMSGPHTNQSPESKALDAKLREQATLRYFYRHEVLGNWPFVLAFLVVPPFALYTMGWVLAKAILWVRAGFAGN